MRQILNVSAELTKKLYDLHQQIRKELGNGNYGVMGKGDAVLLCGMSDNELAHLTPELANPTHLSGMRLPKNCGSRIEGGWKNLQH